MLFWKNFQNQNNMNFDFISAMDGWTTPQKAEAIFNLILKIKPKLCVEIGVFGGRSLIPVALALKQLGAGKIVGIDPWSAAASAAGQVEPNSEKWWGDLNHENIYTNFIWHLKKQGVESFVEVVRSTSEAASPPAEIDFLSLDGNHGEDAVKDAIKFAPFVKLGGYIMLDDLDWAGGFVRRAEDYIKSIGFSFVKLFDGQTGLYQRVEIVDLSMGRQENEIAHTREIIPERPKLTAAYITGRQEPKFEWFLDSLRNQYTGHDRINLIIVDLLAEQRDRTAYDLSGFADVKWVEPKPTVWQGKHRVTDADWWAMSNARNTAFCLCETDWIAFLDDRCVLMPGWLEAIKKAMAGNYIVCGSYQKRSGMEVEGGFIKGYKKLIGDDSRIKQAPGGMVHCPGGWLFGCTFAMPLEQALHINGFEEGCDSLSMEDVIFGMMVKNNGYHLNYDPQMRMIEDRTEGETSAGHDIGGVLKRTDKGVSPNDKSHAALVRFGVRKTTEFTPDLRKIHDVIKHGGGFPIPKEPVLDWYDQQPVKEFK